MANYQRNLLTVIPLSSHLTELRSALCHIIDVDYNLLNLLRNTAVLNDKQIELIQSKQTQLAQVDQLLDFVIHLSSDRQKRFLVALFKSQQAHVNNFILCNGRRPSADEQNWPLNTTDYYHCLALKQTTLTELIDSVNGLLDEMVAAECISVLHKQRIEAQTTSFGKNEVLLRIMKRRSILDFNKFIVCLQKTKQYHVASILKPNADDDNQPLNDEIKKKLLVNRPALIRLMDVRRGLLAALVAADCITWRQRELIDNTSSRAESNSQLLDILMRGSQSDFHKFVFCLIKSHQEHVCRIFLEDGVVARLVARCIKGKQYDYRTRLYSRTIPDIPERHGSNVKQSEAYVVKQIKRLLNKCSVERLKELFSQVVSVGEGVQLIDVDEVSSIGLYYWCTSLMGLLYLTELYTSGQLQVTLNRAFAALLGVSQSLTIDSLSWDRSEFFKCNRHMYDSMGMSIFSGIYLLAHRRFVNDTSFSTSHAPFLIEQLPHELKEIFVIKSAALLFTVLNAVNPLAEVYTVATLSATSSEWRRMLINQKYIKRRLKHNFRRLCHPFKCRSQEVSKLNVESNVSGISEFRNKLYVACHQSNSIIVLNGSPPFDILGNFQIQEMKYPGYIVVCSHTSQPYIAAREQRAIWRVNLLSYKEVDKFISTPWRPLSLSTQYRRLLITPYDSDALFIYGDDGVLLKHIQLPHYFLTTLFISVMVSVAL
jgi:hypothetical protein